VYDARERALERLRHEGSTIGADRVMGNRLVIRELSRGLIEIVAIGTAVRRVDASLRPASQTLPVQAITTGQSSLQMKADAPGIIRPQQVARTANSAVGMVRLVLVIMVVIMSLVVSFMAQSRRSPSHRGTPTTMPT
jgi:hypothetical protein